ncbi:hypothetical protein [Leptolyngbya sp. NIES-2104]|uniref:hypothetical protein n=1 Tax=Leptolyngbya sp. NIES-2104 TaxID=1552121 RepID=UPI0006EC5EC5|nr:hypothetical protein [Leptolyngbya sp. NIES-2104]GAP99507.1 hypothetical protein NIES2104_60730 [Leptolyngbya sp. NIES-2104]
MAEIPIACSLNRDDLSKRQNELNTLRQLVREMRQMPNGFSLCFDGSTENLMTIACVIAQERLCCPFLQFQLIAEKGMGSLWLEVTSSNDSAQFLLMMFGFDDKASSSSSYISNECSTCRLNQG